MFFQHERLEGERERAREQMPRPPLPKPLSSIYKEGGEGCLSFILLVV
jgi:hypothetical protein